ncbi:hypothetical protein [Myxococcus eversor]|uniref:hypothetical protein n=1 Tax=Myxococcus eversor TaxID=2709661 RepID=UPI001967A38A|nr:hypothetical protein [Myxococcus eversor]
MQVVGATGRAQPAHPVHHLRDETFTRLRAYLSPENLEGAIRCVTKLYAALPDKHVLASNTLLVAYGGGKDSSYTLAFVRAIQLILFRIHGSTFRMRVVTNRHAGMPQAVMENIQRCYQALNLFEDPDCELLLVDGGTVRAFDVELPPPESLVRRNRVDILMTGHRTQADARPTFCNACNLSMVNAFGLAAAHGGGVNVIVTGDSRREQRTYLVWVHRLGQQFGLEGPEGTAHKGFKGFLGTMDELARAYFRDIHGGDATEAIQERRIETGVSDSLRFFSIYDDTDYASGDHWELLTGYLGFEFDDLAFSFTESDCANPALMAHLRGLKCERLFGRAYREGIDEYVRFALSLMHQKQFPPSLVDKMRARYSDEAAVTRMREAMDTFAARTYGLSEAQLVCMVYSPFTDAGRNLERYLHAEHPALSARITDIHALLRATHAPALSDESKALQNTLEQVSGLDIVQLRTLYLRPLGTGVPPSGKKNLLGAILERDPHKGVIETRHSPHGPVVLETLSGR